MGARGKLRILSGGELAFHCPGCDSYHAVRVNGDKRPRWNWNGQYEKPTFSPSILVQSGHFISTHKAGDPCWCTRPDAVFKCQRCHSFVTDGKIQFLGDCSHALAGQTVDLPSLAPDDVP